MTRNRHEADILTLVASAGLTLTAPLAMSGGGHYKLDVQAPDGRRCRMTVARSPGDHRWRVNFSADLRRFARGLTATDGVADGTRTRNRWNHNPELYR